MDIDARSLLPGEYTLILESFDQNSKFPKLTLKTDIVTIVVIEALQGYLDTIAHFVTDLEPKTIISGQPAMWNLPKIETHEQTL